MSFSRILVALNQDTNSGSPIFDQALALANQFGAKLMLFHCIPQDTVAELEDRVGASLTELEQSGALKTFDRRHREMIDHVRAWLDGLCTVCTSRGLTIESQVEIGKPGRATVEMAESWKADLIVMGLTQRSALTDWLTSSVTSRVVHGAPCSVMLVHE